MSENTETQSNTHRSKNDEYCLKPRGSSPEQCLLHECGFFSKRINQLLAPFQTQLGHYLPLDEHSLLSSLRDGVVIAYLIHNIRPNSIDLSRLLCNLDLGQLNQPHSKLTFEIVGNHNLVMDAARAIGIKLINIGSQDLLDMKPTLVLGLVWQLIRLSFVDEINVDSHPELVDLISHPGGNASLENLLLYWFNHHLNNSRAGKVLKNLGLDLADSLAYAHLLTRIVPRSMFSIEAGEQFICRVMEQEHLELRAEILLIEMKRLGLDLFVTPKDVVSGNPKANLCLVAELFNRFSKARAEDLEKSQFVAVTEQLAKDRQDFENEIQRLTTAHQAEIRKLMLDHEEVVTNLKTSYREEIKGLRLGYEKEIHLLKSVAEDKIGLLESRHRKDMEILKSVDKARADDQKKQEAMVLEIQAMHEREIHQLKLEHETKMNDLIRHYNDLESCSRTQTETQRQENDRTLRSLYKHLQLIVSKLDKLKAQSEGCEGEHDRIYEIESLPVSVSVGHVDKLVKTLGSRIDKVSDVQFQMNRRIQQFQAQHPGSPKSRKRSIFSRLRKAMSRFFPLT